MAFFFRKSSVIHNRILRVLTLSVFGGVLAGQAQSSNQSLPAEEVTVDLDAVFQTGQSLFEQFAPEEIKAQFRFPTRAEFDEFSGRLAQSLERGSLAELAAYKTEAQTALLALRAIPDYAPYTDWLQERLDYIEAAEAITTRLPSTPPQPSRPPSQPSTNRPVVRQSLDDLIPHYHLWLTRMRTRPVPAASANYVPGLKSIFAQIGTPSELVWLAEIESSFRSDARSPVGAHGLFQFMPGTATDMGLRLKPVDERANPRKSARAAATYLRQLHTQFGSWPLALAAYNAGPGRVSRLLKSKRVSSYSAIADSLPSETRMYVPKVMATVAVRTGITPYNLPAPKAL